MTAPDAPANDWKAFAVKATSGELYLNPEGIERCIQLCKEHAQAMRGLKDFARDKLRADCLGLGEQDIPSTKLIAQKFDEKAIGGSSVIEDRNTAVGLCAAHENYALEMMDMFTSILNSYRDQESANAAALGIEGARL